MDKKIGEMQKSYEKKIQELKELNGKELGDCNE